MTTDPTSATGASTGTTGDTTTTDKNDKTSDLGTDTFLQLLVTQLQNQDPLSPQDNSQFLAQLAQFTQVERLQSIKTDMSALLALAQTGADAASTAADAAKTAAS